MEQKEVLKEELLGLTAEIVSSHVANNSVAVAELPQLIEQVFKTLQQLGAGTTGQEARPDPAVPIKKSITPNYMICLEDGKKLKMLKRHLKLNMICRPKIIGNVGVFLPIIRWLRQITPSNGVSWRKKSGWGAAEKNSLFQGFYSCRVNLRDRSVQKAACMGCVHAPAVPSSGHIPAIIQKLSGVS